MSSYSSTRTTRTVQYSSSGGPGQVVETRTVVDSDGKRTETKTYGYGGDMNNDIRDHKGHSGLLEGGISLKIGPKRYSVGWGGGGGQREPRSSSKGAPVVQFKGTSYEDIRKQCLSQGCLFEDPDFPAVDTSIFYSRSPPRPFELKRPPEIVSDAQFILGTASRFDVQQGELGDCWLLAAVASLSGYDELMKRVVPHDQDFTTDYAGVFHFQFWQYGKWIDVVVDDRLPTYGGRLVFMHSSDHNEFWSALLEKAYAKLCGSYEALKGGSTMEAMEDFSGGVTEMYDFRQNLPPTLFNIMMKAHDRKSMMGCSIDADPGRMEAELANGLIMGHAYSITSVKMMDIQTKRSKGQLPMVRIRNPWGNECEWKGAWSDTSQEWSLIPESERKEMGLTFDNDGEFWMSYQDFIANYQKIEICNLGPDALTEELATSAKKRWEMQSYDGSWKRNVTAGGCRNYLDTFWTNPQYRVQVVDPDEGDDEDLGTIIVAVMQKERRKKRKEGGDLLTVGYAIYKLKDPNSGPLDLNYFKYNASVAKCPAFINLREVCGRHKLAPGHYVIIPSTFEPGQEADFLLRVYAERAFQANEIDEETKISDAKATISYAAPSMMPVAQDILTIKDVPKTDPQQERELKEAFRKISGGDMEVSAYELQDILNAAFKKEFQFEGFSADTCRSLVAMKDVNQSGMLDFEEFKTLWNDIRLWKAVFKQRDVDKSGNFNSYELRQAFHDIGVSISNSTFNALVQRYSHRDGKIYFDDYIHCIARLKTMFDVHREMRGSGTKATFDLDEFIQTTMYS